MKREDLFDAIGNVDDKYILEADTHPHTKHRPIWRWVGGVAACLCLAGIGLHLVMPLHSNDTRMGNASSTGTEESTSEASSDALLVPLAEAVYPELLQEPLREDYPNTDAGYDAYLEDYSACWQSARQTAVDSTASPEIASALSSFAQQTAPLALDGDGSENKVYSPTNLYYALGMMAETTTGDTHASLLTLLELEDDDLVSTLNSLWNDLHQDNGISKTVLANSLWISSTVEATLHQEILEQLASQNYASSYQVEMGTNEANQAIAQWIDQQTDGLLSDDSAQIETDPQSVLSLISTLYFYDQWSNEFNASKNSFDTFTCGDSSLVNVEFMHRTTTGSFIREEQYVASSLNLKGSDRITFILPNEGVTPEALLQESNLIGDALGSGASFSGEVIWSVPKFDVSCDLNLTDTLTSLNLGSLFDGTADFSPLGNGLFLSGVTQSARVLVDEQGVSASSFTQIDYEGAMEPQDTCEMNLNRPFLFIISSYLPSGEVPLYVGIVNVP